ncbi:hypothetical protein GCM10027169_29160 [Gordonia jinhuaensis]|uniref:Uncharacterized protein n=1 Tax=Gordonia jinhuaensis TaxID=1517702 RepID=A0A916T8P5_9ACTN|nr:hypothetical protein [Gordonia jinhuaensis]GGB35924.1 hypothetical protein GCM10011489_24960 [Gordonia jinhuaensis]
MALSPTVPAVAAGLIGGYGVARFTKRRELGGVVLAAAGAYCAKEWSAKGPAVTAGLLATYVGAFGLSHPLAKKLGAWPSVFTVTAAATAATAAATR